MSEEQLVETIKENKKRLIGLFPGSEKHKAITTEIESIELLLGKLLWER